MVCGKIMVFDGFYGVFGCLGWCVCVFGFCVVY